MTRRRCQGARPLNRRPGNKGWSQIPCLPPPPGDFPPVHESTCLSLSSSLSSFLAPSNLQKLQCPSSLRSSSFIHLFLPPLPPSPPSVSGGGPTCGDASILPFTSARLRLSTSAGEDFPQRTSHPSLRIFIQIHQLFLHLRVLRRCFSSSLFCLAGFFFFFLISASFVLQPR